MKLYRFISFLRTVDFSLYASIIVLCFLAISIAGIVYEPFDMVTSKIVNRNYNGEGGIELLEALFWFIAFCIFAYLLFGSIEYKYQVSITLSGSRQLSWPVFLLKNDFRTNGF